MRGAAILSVVLVLAAGVSASTIEDATGVDYQHDGGTKGDASDVCHQPSPVLPVGNVTTGLLVPLDDPRDAYGLDVEPADVGDPITVTLQPAPDLAGSSVEPPAPDHDLVVHSVGCQEPLGNSSNDGTQADQVTFTPAEAGIHVVEVVPGDGGPVDAGPGAEHCHPTCVGGLNRLVGYELTSAGD